MDITGDFNVGSHECEDSIFSGLDHRFDKRVGGAVEDERKFHLTAVDAEVVLHHIQFHDILAGAGVAHLAQGVENEFGI